MLNLSNLKVRPLPFLVSGLAALLFSSAVFSSVAVLRWLGSSVEQADPAIAQADARDAAQSSAPSAGAESGPTAGKPRCEECGVVDSTRQVPATADSPLLYETTLRMSNGSLQVLRDAKPAVRRPGEHIILIGGLSPSGR